jgi:hypothetical protein
LEQSRSMLLLRLKMAVSNRSNLKMPSFPNTYGVFVCPFSVRVHHHMVNGFASCIAWFWSRSNKTKQGLCEKNQNMNGENISVSTFLRPIGPCAWLGWARTLRKPCLHRSRSRTANPWLGRGERNRHQSWNEKSKIII